MATASLPPGAASLDRAWAGHGWLLVSRERIPWGWSPQTGWQVLPSAPRKIEDLRTIADGFLATLDSGKAVGFWAPGSKAWGWWLDARSSFRGSFLSRARWRSDGRLAMTQIGHGADSSCAVYRVGVDGATWLRTFRLHGLGDLRGIEDCGEDAVRVFCASGIARVPVPSGPVVVERWVPLDGEEVRALAGYALIGPDRLSSRSAVTRAVDLVSGTLEEFPWPAGPAFRPFQEAAALGQRARLRSLIEFLASLPPAPGFGDELLAVLEAPAGPVAAATVAGLKFPIVPEYDASAGGPQGFSSWKRDLLPLTLFTDPEEAAPAVARDVLEGRGSEGSELAFVRAFGERACEKLVEALRGQGELSLIDPEGARRLFGRAGRGAHALVQRLLDDPDLACRLLGAIVAGEELLELGAALSGEDNSPEGVPLRESFLRTLRHPEAGIRTAVLDSCSALRLRGVVPDVLERLHEDVTEVRAAAVQALFRLGDAGDGDRSLLREAMNSEEHRVRIAILEGSRGQRAPGELDLAVEALGDPSDRVRYEAFETIAERAGELDAGRFLTAFDAWLLQALGVRAAVNRGAPGFPMNLDSFVSGIVKEIVPDDPPEPELELSRVGALLGSVLVLTPVFEAVATSADGRHVRLDPKDLDDEAAARLEALAPGIVEVLPAVFQVAQENGAARSLAVLSARLATWHPEHADRAAIAALLRARDEGRHGAEDAASEPRNLTLASRLSRLGRPQDGIRACLDRVRARAKGRGTLALSALLVLSLREEAEARRELLRRIETGEVAPWWSVAPAFALASDDAERLAVARRITRSEAVPTGRKAQLLEALAEMDSRLCLVDEPTLVDLAEEIARSSSGLPLFRRARQAWTLGKAGRIDPLEALWRELDPVTPLLRAARYEVALGLSRAGRTEHLDVVRGSWLDEWDLRAVEVLTAHGEERDIPDLEKARERRAPASTVDAAIAAIRARAGRP